MLVMKKKIATSTSDETTEIVTIRVEKELCRFPIHNLSKSKVGYIHIVDRDKSGREINWRVSPSRDYGEPRELAYQVDTLVVNKSIDEAGEIKPKILPLGSLRGICRQLGINEGQSVRRVKQALCQNAFAGITASFKYTGRDGNEKTLSANFTRYSVIFRGDKLPNGQQADRVYLVFNDIYLELINSVKTRPLNYGYLKNLNPISQRFYELVGGQIFAAVKYNLPCAKYLYSAFCQYAPQSRYDSTKQMNKQMYKVIKPHKDSGYLEEVKYERIISTDGLTDWNICLFPGEMAFKECQVFANRRGNITITPGSDGGYEDEEMGLEPTEEFPGGSFLGDLLSDSLWKVPD